MLIGKPTDIPSSAITPKEHYLNRRRFLRRAIYGATAVGVGAGAVGVERLTKVMSSREGARTRVRLNTVESQFTTTGEELNSFNDITHYNNFYEFGVDKHTPALNAGTLPTRPWTVSVDGNVKTPKTFDIETLLKLCPLEDRIYRHRCVEGWSMVIPWVGYSLSEFIKHCEPLSSAKYVQFISYYDRQVEKWSAQTSIDWPYSEGLRMDEAMNPLALLTLGLYGEVLPNQNGAPVRIVVPWKYGFKSAKSIVTVRFLDKIPKATWNNIAPQLYGFYSNVNPDAGRPNWNQKIERRIGQPFYTQRRKTLMFNGYGEQVASLYNGMDLLRDF